MSNIKTDRFIFSNIADSETEFIPLLSSEDEEQMRNESVPDELPVLPLRNTVLFPGVVIPITVGRDKSIKLIREYYKGDRTIGVVSQKDPDIEDPDISDLHSIGTVANIIKLLQMPDGSTTAIIQGRKRFRILNIFQIDPYFKATIEQYEAEQHHEPSQEFNALMSTLKDMAIQIIKQSPNVPSEAAFAIRNIESHFFLVNFISSNLNVSLKEKQRLLEMNSLQQRANSVMKAVSNELQMVELKNEIQKKVKSELDKQQRDYLLNQQLKTIQEELGTSPHEQEIGELKAKAENKKWNKEVKETFEKELAKLERMNPSAVEYSIQLNYLDLMVDLPWREYTEDNFDLDRAQKILDEDHYGLEKVKERIIEYLAVIKLKGDMKSPIIALVGPPGVGKTSLGKSIARAIDRKYIRMSLGGLRDEAEIRGHRKTYIGAMPGRIIQSLKKVKSSNPVFVLDEIDKVMGMNVSGDPSAALLEVLDPEQNINFHDNYLETEYDLSKVMFIATANTLSTVHPALRDRLEVIDINGYLLEEKLEIARRHLLPKQFKEHGVTKEMLFFPKKTLEKIIENYTREAGVRQLEKNIAKIIRNRARFIALESDYHRKLSEDDLTSILGPAPFQKDRDISNRVPGVVTGLAWTSTGGEILFIEVSLSPGKGDLTLTGNLGDVMKESATIAFEYLKSHSSGLNIPAENFKKWNVHIHVPEGATPKDGPSAGIAMFTALASAFTGRKVRSRIAMTGEITLRGKVLPVGGIKDKILAAKRARINHVVLSKENRRNIEDIKPDYIKGLQFHYIDEMIEVIDLALLKEKV